MHESLDESKFRPDTTINSRVICPCASEKLIYNVVNTLAPSFLIGSSSILQVLRTTITSRMSSIFGQIGQWNAGLAALERLENILLKNYSKYFYDNGLQVSDRCPLGYLSLCSEKISSMFDSALVN